MSEFLRYPRRRLRIDPLAAEKFLDLLNLVLAGLIVGILLGDESVSPFLAIPFLAFALFLYCVILFSRR